MKPPCVSSKCQRLNRTNCSRSGRQHESSPRHISQVFSAHTTVARNLHHSQRQTQQSRSLLNAQVRRRSRHDLLHIAQLTRRPQRRQVRQRRTGHHVPATQAEKWRKPLHHPLLNRNCRGGGFCMQQILI